MILRLYPYEFLLLEEAVLEKMDQKWDFHKEQQQLCLIFQKLSTFKEISFELPWESKAQANKKY